MKKYSYQRYITSANLQLLVAGLVLILGIAVRLHRFGEVPAGMNQDELSTAYDAFSILHYGIDRHGVHFPAILIAWGSGMNALPAYLEIPFLALGGVTTLSVRMAQLLLCILSLVVFGLLGRKLRGAWFGIFSMFLLAIAPWHVMLSRWALDENFFPAIFLLAVFLQVLACERSRYLPFAFFFFGLSLYAHGAAYFAVPVYVLLSTAYMVWHRRYTLRWLLVSVCILLAMAMPAGLSLLINGRHLPPVLTPFFSIPRLTGPPRYEAVSSVFDVNPFASVAMHARVLWQFLFTQTQSDGAIFNTVPGYGLLYLFSMPFVLLGAVLGIWRLRVRGFHTEALMLLWLLTALALGLVIDANVNRMNVLLLPVVFFLAEGLLYLCATRLQRCVVIMVYLASFLLFCKTYFTSYAAEVRWDFHDSFDRAIRLASARPGTVCITDSINMAYVYVLFWEKIDPRLFAKTVVYENPGGEFQSVRSFGRYIFGLSHCPLKRASALVLDSGGRLPVNKRDRHQWTLNQVDGFTVALRVVPARRRHGSK